MHVCWSDLNYSRAMMHNQLTAVVPEIAVDIPLQDSAHGADPGDTAVQKDKGQPSVPLAVCKYMVECTSSAHGFHQVSDDDKRTQTILQDTQKKLSDINSIPGPAGTDINVIDHANTAMTVLDTIDATYLQPLKTFNTVVNAIANASCISRICSDPV